MHINKLFFHLYCKQTKMHTRTHTYTHTETHSERGIFERRDTFLPHVFIFKTRSPFLVLSKKCGNKTQTARTATAAKNVVSKGNRQETNMAIHFLKPEVLSLSLSLSLALSFALSRRRRRQQQQTYSKHRR